jgi:hypothetical protein
LYRHTDRLEISVLSFDFDFQLVQVSLPEKYNSKLVDLGKTSENRFNTRWKDVYSSDDNHIIGSSQDATDEFDKSTWTARCGFGFICELWLYQITGAITDHGATDTTEVRQYQFTHAIAVFWPG